jgi:hypothetical protein
LEFSDALFYFVSDAVRTLQLLARKIWNLFYAMTKIMTSDGNKASFWDAPWADGLSPKVIALSIYALSNRMAWTVSKALANDAWILQIDIFHGLSVQHLQEFTNLWQFTSQVNLIDDTRTPLFGSSPPSDPTLAPRRTRVSLRQVSIRSPVDAIVWKNWTPLKCKLFVWLILENRVWAADCLEEEGGPTRDLPPLSTS